MFSKILVPVDLAQRSSWLHALPQATELASAGNGTLTVMTVVRDLTVMFEGAYLPFQIERLVSEAGAKLAQIVSEVPSPDVSIAQQVRCGSIGHEILAAAKELDCDLIVMASHRPRALDHLIGPNAAHVAQRAQCSVLVLRRFEQS